VELRQFVQLVRNVDVLIDNNIKQQPVEQLQSLVIKSTGMIALSVQKLNEALHVGFLACFFMIFKVLTEKFPEHGIGCVPFFPISGLIWFENASNRFVCEGSVSEYFKQDAIRHYQELVVDGDRDVVNGVHLLPE
jgi:hypothetical protein